MDLKEIKKIANFASRAGVKSIKIDGLEISFKDEIIFQRPRAPGLVPDGKTKAAKDEPTVPPREPPPTLDEINQYIYGQTDEAG